MAPRWRHRDANLYGQHRYAAMSQDLLLQRALDILGQMQDTLKQSEETTRQLQATMKVQEAHTRQMVCKWDNLFKIVHDLEQEEATKEDITLVEPDINPSVPEIPNTKLPDPLRSFTEQPAKNVGDLIEPMDEGFNPATNIEPMDAQLVTAVMTQTVEKPFPPLVVCDNTEQLPLAERSVALQLVARKHRWRWKPVEEDEDAAADDSVGEVDESHGSTRVFFSCRSCSPVSMNKAEDVTSLDATYLGCPTSCYVAVDYSLHLQAHHYVASDAAPFYFPIVGQVVLAFVTKDALTTLPFVLSTTIRALATWPLLVETQQQEPNSIRSSFVFQLSTKCIEVWISNILVNFWRISYALQYYGLQAPSLALEAPWVADTVGANNEREGPSAPSMDEKHYGLACQ